MKKSTLTFAILALVWFPMAWGEDNATMTAPQWLAQADALAGAGKNAEAETAYQNATQAAPSEAQYPLRLGGFYLSQQRSTDAVAQFQRAIGLDSRNAKAFAALGLAYWHQGDYALAEAALAEALQRDANLPETAKLLTKLKEKNSHEKNSPASPH